jgi:hypothetical protein
MAANPNPTRISSAMWRLWEDFHQWEPKSKLGGIYADKAGYHNYRNALPVSDYSRRLSADMRGSGTKASAFDFTMPTAEMKKYTTRLDDTHRCCASSSAPRTARTSIATCCTVVKRWALVRMRDQIQVEILLTSGTSMGQ